MNQILLTKGQDSIRLAWQIQQDAVSKNTPVSDRNDFGSK